MNILAQILIASSSRTPYILWKCLRNPGKKALKALREDFSLTKP
jgi:hypothetical protein